MTSQDIATLSEREKQALRLLLAGHDAKSIATALGLSVYTVNDRLRDARRKLGVSSSREAARRLAEREQGTPNFVGAKQIGDAVHAAMMASIERPAAVRSLDRRIVWIIGGLLVMVLIIAVVALAIVVATPNVAPGPADRAVAAEPRLAETDVSAAARHWVGLLDDGRWDASWQAAGSTFRTQLTSAQWAETIQPVRQPLGRAASRTLQSTARTTTLPGAPAGDYQVLQFQTRFANKSDAIETVVLSREQQGWYVDGYFIR